MPPLIMPPRKIQSCSRSAEHGLAQSEKCSGILPGLNREKFSLRMFGRHVGFAVRRAEGLLAVDKVPPWQSNAQKLATLARTAPKFDKAPGMADFRSYVSVSKYPAALRNQGLPKFPRAPGLINCDT
ncbi:hypothetical protein [Bradyrhizobium sp. Gha]|uniref:hypothetical protein n=1 Tax=Bradyrhizobium sp. Gha TaxID=1855318 RepID=UPI0008EF1113|nr:hypothetical protein [Bradyrhizobium sp. Gha]SFJ45500.1 hypothetical protein SAMN05216525_12599 [Bradyrhizobium sp. Gha]